MLSRVLTLLAFALVAAACTSAPEPAPEPPVPPSSVNTTAPLQVVPRSYDDFRAQPTACGADQPAAVAELAFPQPEDMDITGPVRVVIETSCGSIVAMLDPVAAPETVNSFVFLASEGYFDGSASHRVFPGFIIQAGDPTATGFGGPGYTIADEFPSESVAYSRGVLAMANAGPGTTGSQFFIVLADAPLPPQFSVFGEVEDGFEVLDAITAVPLGAPPGGADPVPTTPLATVYIETVSVEQ